jgi:hypothetical protein
LPQSLVPFFCDYVGTQVGVLTNDYLKPGWMGSRIAGFIPGAKAISSGTAIRRPDALWRFLPSIRMICNGLGRFFQQQA